MINSNDLCFTGRMWRGWFKPMFRSLNVRNKLRFRGQQKSNISKLKPLYNSFFEKKLDQVLRKIPVNLAPSLSIYPHLTVSFELYIENVTPPCRSTKMSGEIFLCVPWKTYLFFLNCTGQHNILKYPKNKVSYCMHQNYLIRSVKWNEMKWKYIFSIIK